MRQRKISRFTLLPVLSLLAALVTAPAPVAAAEGGPRIDRIEILVLKVPERDVLATVRPGEVLELPAGQTVRLRMTAVPSGAGARYPSTRFAVVPGRVGIEIKKAVEEVGNFTFSAFEERNPRNARQETAIQYEILDKLNIARELTTGKIWVRLAAEPPPVAEYGDPAPAPGFSGIILYENEFYRGRSANFTTGEVPALRWIGIGQDSASSVRIEPGCRAILYEHEGFRGRSTEVTSDIPDLRVTGVGNDRVSSLKMDCSERDRRDRRDGHYRRH